MQKLFLQILILTDVDLKMTPSITSVTGNVSIKYVLLYLSDFEYIAYRSHGTERQTDWLATLYAAPRKSLIIAEVRRLRDDNIQNAVGSFGVKQLHLNKLIASAQ